MKSTRQLNTMASGRTLLRSFLFIFVILETNALNILVLTAIQTHSHFTFGNSVTTALLEGGHQVWELTSIQPKSHPNRTSFVIQETMPSYNYDLTSESEESLFRMVMRMAEWCTNQCTNALGSRAASDLLALARDPQKRPHIDVVVYDYVFLQCLGPFVTEFGNPPIVAITAYGNSVEIDEVVGSPMFPSFVPHDLAPYPFDKPMTWAQRMHNRLIYLWSDAVRNLWQFPKMEAQARDFFGENASTVAEIQQRVAVSLVNAHPAFHGVRPQLPSVVQIGGIHVQPPKDLPDGDMKRFLDSAADGFILMNFGSMVRVSSMEPWRRREVMRAFDRLRPQKVLLKWEEAWDEVSDGNIPDNVMIRPWIPQTDVLAHPNIRVFVTHCGGLSTNEILHRAVPVLAVPFFLDQNINANHFANLNMGRVLRYAELREDNLYAALRDVIDNKRYIEAARRMSVLVRDEMSTPRERVVFWVEFVARNKGASHLQSTFRHLPWITRWMVDDIILVAVLGYLVNSAARSLLRCWRRKSKKKTE